MRIAVLSNVNMNGVIRILKKSIDVFDAEGYGNEIGTLLNQKSSFWMYKPEAVFIIEDIQELTGHLTVPEMAEEKIFDWFTGFESTIKPEILYYISDAFCYGFEMDVLVDVGIKEEIEEIWLKHLRALIGKHSNIRIFPYRKAVLSLGEGNAFSPKMWYMGKILHSISMQQLLASMILERIEVEKRLPKKVLLLDLDNTLWGGLAGEDDVNPIILSEDHVGLAYKNLQRVILMMKKQGVILGIVSKNNYEDAMNIVNNHSHMVLKNDDFAVKRINWEDKNKSVEAIAAELNVGLDSMVFFDDNPSERLLIKSTLPMVCVPDFPEKPEELPNAMVSIWKEYFEKAILTDEDLRKTDHYIANSKRDNLKKKSASYEQYLKDLRIILFSERADEHIERVVSLINKTNQFNMTTHRHTLAEIEEMMKSGDYDLFAYREEDIFGDNGIISVVVVNYKEAVPVIEEFVMSCRVMGKNIENAILEDVERHVFERGYMRIRAAYIPSSKNTPVSHLYESLGYHLVNENDAGKLYEISLPHGNNREYWLTKN